MSSVYHLQVAMTGTRSALHFACCFNRVWSPFRFPPVSLVSVWELLSLATVVAPGPVLTTHYRALHIDDVSNSIVFSYTATTPLSSVACVIVAWGDANICRRRMLSQSNPCSVTFRV